jgi:DNA-binding PadR family transcriptional regulator
MHTAYVSVRLGLLALLDGADMYGYQLKTAFEAHTGGVWPLNIGQVYTTLARLERDGLVAASARHGGPAAGPADDRPEERQHVYSITAAGRRVLADWYAESPADGPPPRDELITKVLLASVAGTEQALRVVTAQRTALTAALQARRRALREAARPVPQDAGAVDADADDEREALAAALVQDALVVRAESELRWLDQCEVRLMSRRAAGAPTGRSS